MVREEIRPAGITPWETEAANWIAWARTPGHDVFEHFAPAFFDEILPEPGGLALEIGCGEGRVVRRLLEHRHRVVGLDASPTLVRSALDANATAGYVGGDATALPFAAATFGVVVAYNSLQTMQREDDMASAVREASRVLKPGGYLCACVAHPMTDLALITASGSDAELDYSASYFEPREVSETVNQRGLGMTFHGWTYTLTDYVRAFEDAAFVIDRMREPRPREEQIAARPSLARWRRLPLFLFIRGIKSGGRGGRG